MIRVTLALAAALLPVPDARAQRLDLVAEGFRQPLAFVADPGHAARFYIVEQPGTIRVIEHGAVLPEPFFGVDEANFTRRNWEQGLLGIALDPGWNENRRFYVNYTASDGSTHVSRFTADAGGLATIGQEEVIIRIPQPYGNHNGGTIEFGPDGMLYIGMGDGGAADDPHDNGQRLDSLLGKMLRIDVTGTSDEGLAYAVPPDNPFVGREGVRGEIWAYGLRNPWKFTFDSQGRMWIGDVGQNRFEEIHLQKAGSKGGENYGWKVMEGPGLFRPGGQRRDDPRPLPPAEHARRGMEAPVWWYRQEGTGSVTGGYFYEGSAVPALSNRYIFAEFETGKFFSFRLDGQGRASDVTELTRRFAPALGGEAPRQAIASFGRDTAGELYVLDLRGGKVYRIVP
jgi:glucose/arabinose dehydrogenase